MTRPRASPTMAASIMEREADVVIRGDERKFKQILLDLLSNAVKLTPEGGKISVRLGKGSTFTLAEQPS